MTVPTHASAFADGAAYERTLGPAHRYYIRVKARLLERLLGDVVPGGRRLADFGCGTGEMEEALHASAFNVVGLDLAGPMIEHARAKRIPRAEFQVADASGTGLPDASFDAAFATALFHHVPPAQRVDVAREMARVVRPGGVVLIFEHNPRNPITRRVARSCPVDRDAILLPLRETRSLLAAAGLEDVRHRYLLFFPRFLAWLSPLDRLFSRVNMGGQYVAWGRVSNPGDKS